MKKLLIALLIAPLCVFAADKPAAAKAEKPAAPKVEKADKYQVTGPVAEVTDTKIVVMKGTERFEVSRSANTKVTGDLKVGAKVTIKYVMTVVFNVTGQDGFESIERLFNQMAGEVAGFAGLTWATLGETGVTVPV